jgi:hypothetical protein
MVQASLFPTSPRAARIPRIFLNRVSNVAVATIRLVVAGSALAAPAATQSPHAPCMTWATRARDIRSIFGLPTPNIIAPSVIVASALTCPS